MDRERDMPESFGIRGFISTSFLDWPGKVCAVIFLSGCNFRCHVCHNHKLVVDPNANAEIPLRDILDELKAKRDWIDGVTVTGGEPTIRKNLPDLLTLLKEHGLKIKLDTNGSNPSMLRELIGRNFLDAVSMDVKAPLTDEEYSLVAGVPVDVRVIKRSIDILKSSDLEVAFRTTAIPGLVEENELERIVGALGNVTRFTVQGFRPLETLDPEFGLREEFGLERLEEMRSRFEIPSVESRVPRRYAYAG